MAPVFSKVTNNSLGAGQFCDACRQDRIGFGDPSRLTDRSHMVNVDG